MPIERFQDVGQRQALARLIQPFVLRRTKAEVATELPPRTDIRRDVILSRDERRLYDAARLEALQAVTGTTETRPEQKRFQVLAALTRLRQLACHPKLLDPQSSLPSAKLEALRHLVADLRAEGHKALVFSQFTRHLDLVEAMLTEDAVTFRRLDGSTAERQRRDEVDAFQRGEADVFLLSLKAGGTGLNLTAASYVIHLDPGWNPAVEDQATDRAHRIGQDKPVTVYRLVAQGTVEEAILALHADKRALVAGLLDGTGGAGAMTVQELVGLIEHGGREQADDPADPVTEAVAALAAASPVSPPRAAPAVQPSGSMPCADGAAMGAVALASAASGLAAWLAALDRAEAVGKIAPSSAEAYRGGARRLVRVASDAGLSTARPDLARAALDQLIADRVLVVGKVGAMRAAISRWRWDKGGAAG